VILRPIRRYGRVGGVRGLVSALRGKITRTPTLVRIDRPDIRFPLYLRFPSSDIRAFEQIFVKREYEFDVKRSPRTIVDAGANIGLASLYFANKYSDAKIIAVEPERGNFEVLQRNAAPYSNIVPVRAALWHENKSINLVDPDRGEWAFMTQAQEDEEEDYGAIVHEVPGMTVDAIMREHEIDHIDVMKIDIEGAEREVFKDPSPWIGKVDTLIVELHERLKLGCNRSFYNATNGFDDEWLQGENVYLTRSSGCVARRPGPAR
jgi:FkbM family methyltransferase